MNFFPTTSRVTTVLDFRKSSLLCSWIKATTSHPPGENAMTKEQEKDLFTE